MDEPHVGFETAMLAAHEAKMRALIGRVVTTQRGDGIVVKAYSPDVVNLVMLPSLRPMISVVDFASTDGPTFICPVFYRAPSGVQYVALVQRITPLIAEGVPDGSYFDLLVLSDGYVDLGSGPGAPIVRESVPHGQGHECWQTELDA